MASASLSYLVEVSVFMSFKTNLSREADPVQVVVGSVVMMVPVVVVASVDVVGMVSVWIRESGGYGGGFVGCCWDGGGVGGCFGDGSGEGSGFSGGGDGVGYWGACRDMTEIEVAHTTPSVLAGTSSSLPAAGWVGTMFWCSVCSPR